MKNVFIAAGFLAVVATSVNAAPCGNAETEYTVDWVSSVDEDNSVTGRPTKASAFPSGKNVKNAPFDEIGVRIAYGGDIRRFSFDSPKVYHAKGAKNGLLEISQDLAEPTERTETRIIFDRPAKRVTFELYDVDESSGFGSAYKDHVSINGYFVDSDPIDASIRFFGLPIDMDKPRMSYERSKGLSGNNIYPVPLSGLGQPSFASYRVTFTKPTLRISLKMGTLQDDASGYASTKNPAPQRVHIGPMSFCVPS